VGVNERLTGTPLDRVAVEGQPGNRLLVIDLAATLVLGVVLALAVAAPETVGVLAAGWSLLLFAAGCGLFLWAYAIAVQRSRIDAVGIDGLFFLTGTAPPPVRRRFLGLLAAQSLLSIIAAASRPFTAVAFGVLAPIFGLGIQGLWAARHGRFEPRHDLGRRASDR
jgi:hypothetical protein